MFDCHVEGGFEDLGLTFGGQSFVYLDDEGVGLIVNPHFNVVRHCGHATYLDVHWSPTNHPSVALSSVSRHETT